ncbi:MAG: pterin 4 alpha carbinolamine dehydratase-domain-containing protein [Monoraphidium minutum]|nr:MAG: pterin 4 alpha carbinolamine dehydratase-domain-containing protein [Monoraphidium minutum]
MASAASEPPSADGLAETSCSLVGGCSPDTPKVPPEELPGLLAIVPAWRLSGGGDAISRSFTAKNFVAAVNFLNRITPVVEEEGHHPDVHITNWRDVEIVFTTHAIGGLAMADFVMAAKVDRIPVDYSPKWLKQQQAAGVDVPGVIKPPPAGGS